LKRARRPAFAKIRPIVDHELACRGVRDDLNAPVKPPFAELHALPGEAALFQDPHRSGSAVVSR
jgi:hypothetical protein